MVLCLPSGLTGLLSVKATVHFTNNELTNSVWRIEQKRQRRATLPLLASSASQTVDGWNVSCKKNCFNRKQEWKTKIKRVKNDREEAQQRIIEKRLNGSFHCSQLQGGTRESTGLETCCAETATVARSSHTHTDFPSQAIPEDTRAKSHVKVITDKASNDVRAPAYRSHDHGSIFTKLLNSLLLLIQ